VSGYAVPWAATVIGHLPSFLIIHGLFFLARRDLERFAAPFATLFLDLVRYIDEQWDVLVSCIKNGTLPDLEGIGHVRAHLQESPPMVNMILNVAAEGLHRHSSLQIPRAQRSCLTSALRPPLRDGSPAFGQTRAC
jgi:hypothetical protein